MELRNNAQKSCFRNPLVIPREFNSKTNNIRNSFASLVGGRVGSCSQGTLRKPTGKLAPRAPQKLSTPPLCSIFCIDSENDNESFRNHVFMQEEVQNQDLTEMRREVWKKCGKDAGKASDLDTAARQSAQGTSSKGSDLDSRARNKEK